MIVAEIHDPDLLDRLGQSDAPRTRGVLHISDVYKIVMRRLQPRRFDASKPMDLRRVEIGLLFETMLERALAEKFATVRPGELIVPMTCPTCGVDTSVYLSPDGVNPFLIAGEEYKASFMSSGKGLIGDDGVPLLKFEHWFIQMKAYAKWLDTLVFVLRVLFLNGDYKWHKDARTGESYPTGPQFRSWRVEFTPEEIDINWQMLTNVAWEEGLLSCGCRPESLV